MKNITYPLGGIAIIDRVEKEFGLFSSIFKGIEGGMKNFLPLVKVHVNNKLTHSVSTHQILENYPMELIEKNLVVKGNVAERTLYKGFGEDRKILPGIT